MLRYLIFTFLAAILTVTIRPAVALTGVHPTGVNVKTTGVSTIFLTFQGTAGERPVTAFWCGELQGGIGSNQVTNFDPCVPGTRFGNLPQRNNLGQSSGTGGSGNFTDIMSIPSSVARRAHQSAVRGDNSSFFYVCQFQNIATGAQSFVAVTCRLAGGGARVPLAITDVRINFIAPEGRVDRYT